MNRHVEWLPLGRLRPQLKCGNGHAFTPDLRLDDGRGEVVCKTCRDVLLLVAFRDVRLMLVVSVTRAELAAMETRGMVAPLDLLWLVTHPELEVVA